MTLSTSSQPAPSARVAVLYAALASYVLGFALFAPRVLSVVDEDRYVSQALAFSQGRTTLDGSGIIIPPVRVPMISDYPPGTSLLQAPLVWSLGWRGAAVLSVAALIATTLLTAAWLRDGAKSPAFALLIPGFLGASLFGRVAMSDMPAGALVALAIWLLWRADRRRPWLSLAVGAVAGAALLFREPLAMLLAPLIVGAMVRGKIHARGLFAGGAAGLAVRLALSQAFFGDALYVRDSDIGFSAASLAHTLPVYGFILLVMFPGGALLPFLYRGERRAELLGAVAAYVMVFLLYDYDVVGSNGLVKGTMLAARYMIPLIPVLAWMAADVWPRAFAALPGSVQSRPRRLVLVAGAAVAAASFLIHPLMRVQEQDALGIVRGMFENTSAATPLITNSDATLKYLSPAYGSRRLILRQQIRSDTVPALLQAFGALSIVLLDRVDTELFRKDAKENNRFVADLGRLCELKMVYRADFAWASLRVLDINRCR